MIEPDAIFMVVVFVVVNFRFGTGLFSERYISDQDDSGCCEATMHIHEAVSKPVKHLFVSITTLRLHILWAPLNFFLNTSHRKNYDF